MIYEFAEVIGRSVWAMAPASFRHMVKAAAAISPEAAHAKMQAAARPEGPIVIGDVAVIDVSGPITYRESLFSFFFGSATIQGMQRQFRLALADPAVKTILFRIDSPGGAVDMVPEFADEIFRARGQKPMIAVADTMMASAAYWIGSQADSIIMGSLCSWAGSIGVFVEHDDISKALEMEGVSVTLISAGAYKTEGNPFEPLGKDAKARYQAEVDKVHAYFLQAVGRGRGTTAAEARKSYGEGLLYMGAEAISLGVADRRASFDDTLTRLVKGRSRSMAAEITHDQIKALIASLERSGAAPVNEPWPALEGDGSGEAIAPIDDSLEAIVREAGGLTEAQIAAAVEPLREVMTLAEPAAPKPPTPAPAPHPAPPPPPAPAPAPKPPKGNGYAIEREATARELELMERL